jgi:hypothetical protein
VNSSRRAGRRWSGAGPALVAEAGQITDLRFSVVQER